jgi:hypothetical protein
MHAPRYAFSHASQDESRRLEPLEQRLDPLTKRQLDRLAIGVGRQVPGSVAAVRRTSGSSGMCVSTARV